MVNGYSRHVLHWNTGEQPRPVEGKRAQRKGYGSCTWPCGTGQCGGVVEVKA